MAVMHGPAGYRTTILTGLSGRLLALTAAFVMLAEVLVYIPSISRYRLTYLEDKMEKAHLAMLALEPSPQRRVDEALRSTLLYHVGAHAIVLREPDRRVLMLSGAMPAAVDATFDLADASAFEMVRDALVALLQNRNRILRVIAPSPRAPEATLEVLLDESPMRQAMYAFSWRILGLSLIISFLTAVLVYLTLQWLMVRPMTQLIDGITRFRTDPEDESASITPSDRSDEIGMAQREFAEMQRDIRAALRQKTRLAALGSALAKINHDLRNTLTTATLVSDGIASSADPRVRKLAPRLLAAIDRATALCRRTLDFAREEYVPIEETVFPLGGLFADVASAVIEEGAPVTFLVASGGEIEVRADREQLFRAFSNLLLNAVQAGARTIRARSRIENDAIVIDLEDDGPGIPPAVRQRLFQPFATTTRDHGSGLGLVICREILTAHGGDITLAETGPEGTTFRLRLPLRRRPSVSGKGLAKTHGIGNE